MLWLRKLLCRKFPCVLVSHLAWQWCYHHLQVKLGQTTNSSSPPLAHLNYKILYLSNIWLEMDSRNISRHLITKYFNTVTEMLRKWGLAEHWIGRDLAGFYAIGGTRAGTEPNLKAEGITKIHNEHFLHTVTLFFGPLKRNKTFLLLSWLFSHKTLLLL